MRRFLNRSISSLAYIPQTLRHHVGKPRPTSFYQRAFNANRLTAVAVANTRYLQSMQDGTLSPLRYGCFTVQDAYYCYRAQDTLELLLKKVDHAEQAELFGLLESKVHAYVNYNSVVVEGWHIRNADSVIPTETMRFYAEHERRVALEEEPIYTLVAYLPCHHLWPWFARRLMTSPRYRPGVYREWFEGVYPGERESFGDAWLLGNYIEEWKKDGKPFDEDLMREIYRRSMDFELWIFTEACESA